MGQLQLSFLGAPEVRHDGERVSFRTRKALALLVYLAVEEGMHTREKLAAIFWPENDASSGRTNLRNALVHLRRPLRHDGQTPHLHVERDALGFNRDGVFTSDWDRLQEAARSSRASLLQSVVDDARGDFLDGFTLDDAPAFDDWMALRREQAHRQMEVVFDRLSQMQEDAGQMEAAVATSERWLQHNPLNEAAYRRLMRLHLATGNQAAARAAYEQCRATLARELGVEPAAETEALAERVEKVGGAAEKQPAAAGRAPATRGDVTGPAAIPLVGRAEEHAQLVNAFRAAGRSRPQVVVLLGEAGVGKTRLAGEFLAWAAAQGADVLRGRAFETGGRLTYQPIVRALRPRLEAENAPEDLLGDVWLTELSRLLPELRERYPDLPLPAGGDQAAQARLFEAVARLGTALAQRAAGAPVLLFVDDVQWADAATLDLLQYATGRWQEDEASILLLLARRTEHSRVESQTKLERWLEGVARETALTEVALEALTAEEVRALVQTLAQEGTAETASAGFAQWLFAETGGQPFYIGEMVEALLEQGRLAAKKGSGLDLTGMVNEAGNVRKELRGFLPPGVHRVIRARLAQLSAEAFRLATAGAVLGQTFSFDRLCRVAGAAEMESLPALDALLQNRILVEGEGRQPYAFAHDKIRDVVYTEAGDARRRLFHRRALDALEKEGGSPAEMAHHARRAGAASAAVRYGIAAGDEALDLFAVRDAAAYYEEARQTLAEQEEVVIPPDLIRHLHERLGRAYDILGEYARAEAVYREMASRGEEDGDLAMQALALNRTATVRAYRHDYAAAAALLDEALPLAETSGDQRALAETHWNLAQMGIHGGDPATMEAHARQALELARELEDDELIARCLNALAYDARNRCQPLEAMAYAGEALERYRALGDQALEADCLGVMAQAEMMAGRPEDAARHARAALEISREIESEHGMGFNAPMLAIALLDGGRYGEAASVVDRFKEAVGTPEEPYERLLAGYVESTLRRVLLDTDRAITIYDEALAPLAEEDDVLFQMDRILRAGRAEAHALHGAWEQACRDVRAALPVENLWLLFLGQHRWWLHVEALLRGGEEAAAGELVNLLEETAVTAGRLAVPAHRARAVVVARADDPEGAAVHLEKAAALAEEMGLPGERWQALAAQAGVAAERGKEGQAAALREEAAEIVEALATGMDDEAARRRFQKNAEKLLTG